MKNAKELRQKLWAGMLALMVGAGVFVWGFFSSGMVGHAETQAKVTSPKGINIRQEASTSSATVSGAENGKVLKVLNQVQGSDGYTWYQVEVNANTTGYVRSDLVEVTGDTPTQSGGGEGEGGGVPEGVTPIDPVSATVQGDAARIRDRASSEGNILAEIPPETVLTATGQATAEDGRIWYQVSYISESAQVDGFIRSDFVVLSDGTGGQGEGSAPEEAPPQDTAPEVKRYDTLLRDGEWLLVDNEAPSPQGYSIEKMFESVNKNTELLEASQKEIKNQKLIIIILVILVVAASAGIGFLVFKIRDMMDSAYFNEVEKETLRKKSSGGQRGMQTVGSERPAAGNKPGSQRTVPNQTPQGRTQRPAGAVQGARPAGTSAGAKPMQNPAGKSPVRPGPASGQKPAGAQQGQRAAGAVQGGRPAMQSIKPPGAPQNQRPAGPAQGGRPAGSVRPQRAADAPQGARPSVQGGRPVQSAQAAAQKARNKNFLAEDDEFEYGFLGKDGDEEQ